MNCRSPPYPRIPHICSAPAASRRRWDRMPFLHNIASGGGAASYAPALSETTGMFVIANFGSSQGFDNDDGSNHDHTRRNFFYQARP